MITVYIAIGNSDDKLTQLEWSQFLNEVDRAVTNMANLQGTQVHGRWHSLATEPWQNACWCVSIDESLVDRIRDFRTRLNLIRGRYRQDSIAWSVAETEFIGADGTP